MVYYADSLRLVLRKFCTIHLLLLEYITLKFKVEPAVDT